MMHPSCALEFQAYCCLAQFCTTLTRTPPSNPLVLILGVAVAGKADKKVVAKRSGGYIPILNPGWRGRVGKIMSGRVLKNS